MKGVYVFGIRVATFGYSGMLPQSEEKRYVVSLLNKKGLWVECVDRFATELEAQDQAVAHAIDIRERSQEIVIKEARR